MEKKKMSLLIGGYFEYVIFATYFVLSMLIDDL